MPRRTHREGNIPSAVWGICGWLLARSIFSEGWPEGKHFFYTIDIYLFGESFFEQTLLTSDCSRRRTHERSRSTGKDNHLWQLTVFAAGVAALCLALRCDRKQLFGPCRSRESPVGLPLQMGFDHAGFPG
jgi:hypothetical protein